MIENSPVFAQAKNGIIHGQNRFPKVTMHQPAEDNNLAHRSPSLEHGLLADDLAFFRARAKDAFDPSIRSGAARLVSLIEFFGHPESPFHKIIQQVKFAENILQLSDQEIGRYLALTARDDESELRKLLRASSLPWVLLAMLPRDHPERRDVLQGFEMALTFLCVFYNAAIRREYLARRTKNEDVNGRAMREILVEESKRGELIMKLGGRIARRWFFPGERRWRSEDVPAEAYIGLWQRLGQYTQTNPVAADQDCLCAFMQGSLNRIPGKVVDHIRSRIETANRQLEIQVPEEYAVGPADPHNPSHQSRRVLAEMVIDQSGAEHGYTKILVEQFVSGLEPKDQKIFELCVVEGRTQKDAGTMLGVGQALISKRLGHIRRAWQNFSFQESDCRQDSL